MVGDDIREGVDDPVSRKFLPHQHATQTRVLYKNAVPWLVTKDGNDEEGRGVKDGLLGAKKATVGDKHLHVVVGCSTKGVSVGCARLPCNITRDSK